MFTVNQIQQITLIRTENCLWLIYILYRLFCPQIFMSLVNAYFQVSSSVSSSVSVLMCMHFLDFKPNLFENDNVYTLNLKGF